MSEKKQINWKAIKAEYVTSDISLAKIAEKYSVSKSAVQKRSTKEKWAAEKRKQEQKAAAKVAKKLSDRNVRKTVSDIERVCLAAGKLIAKINRAIDEVDKKEKSKLTIVKEKKEIEQDGKIVEVEKTCKESKTEIYKGLVDTKSIAEISKSLLNIKQVLDGTEKKDEDKKIGIIELPTMQLLTPPEDELLKNEE